jgi:hypothetical protein
MRRVAWHSKRCVREIFLHMNGHGITRPVLVPFKGQLVPARARTAIDTAATYAGFGKNFVKLARVAAAAHTSPDEVGDSK